MIRRSLMFLALFVANAWATPEASTITVPNQDAEAGRILLRIFSPDDYDSSVTVTSVAQSKDGAIYVATAEGVSRYNGRNWEFSPSPVVPVIGLTAMPDNTILISSPEAHASLRFSLKRGVEITPLENHEPSLESPLPQAVYPDPTGTLTYPLKSGLTVKATSLNGVSVPLPNGLRWKIDSLRGLTGREVTCLLEDREGGLWIGTDYGISRADLSSPVTLYLRRDGLERSPIRAYTRTNGQLIVAQNRGVYRMIPANTLDQPVAKFEPLPSVWMQPADLLTTMDGELLIASQAGENIGLHILSNDPTMLETLSKQPFHSLIAVPDSDEVLALGQGVIARLQPTDQGWQVEITDCEWANNNLTTAWENSKSLWFGDDEKGFARLTPAQTGWPQHTLQEIPIERPNPKVALNRLVQNGDAPLFLTENGLYHYRSAEEDFEADLRSKPWSSNSQMPMTGLVQPDGRLWVRLHSPQSPERSQLVLLAADGELDASLPGNALRAIDFDGDGHLYYDAINENSYLWVAGYSGLLRYDLSEVNRPFIPPARPLVRLIDAPAATDPDAEHLKFTVYRGSMHFSYSVPDYRTGARWTYQTKLNDDAAWSIPSSRANTLLQDLPSGSYVWSVRAVNELGLPGPAREIAFVLRDPWHRTWEAYALYLILAGTAVMLFVKWRLAGSRREQLRLKGLVTERTVAWQQAAARAETASQAKTVFLANASHELRTPLNAILGYAQLLEGNTKLPDTAKKPVTTIRQSGQHLLRLINHVLDLAKFESGVSTGNPETITLRPFVEDIAVAHQITAGKKGLTLKVEIDAASPNQVIVDSLRLRQVLDNLIGNAVKFTTTGRIQVSVRTDSADAHSKSRYHRLNFQVQDTGPGIGESDLEKIFEPFKQTATGETEGHGTGLGLALAQRMVELMGGQLSVQSELGKGTTFSFSLALAQGSADLTPSSKPFERPSGYQGARRRLLIVDDEEFNRQLLRDLLAPLGFEIDLASSAAELFARLTLGVPDAIILDLRMPGINGIEAMARLRQDYTSDALKIIAHSASIDTATRDSLAQSGCDAFLPKPFHEAELHTILAETLGLKWESGTDETA